MNWKLRTHSSAFAVAMLSAACCLWACDDDDNSPQDAALSEDGSVTEQDSTVTPQCSVDESGKITGCEEMMAGLEACQAVECRQSRCVKFNRADCCRDANDCPKGNACQIPTCSEEQCGFEQIPECCLNSSQCGDPIDACHNAACSDHRCVQQPIPDCCLSSDECPVSDICHLPTCENKKCGEEAIPNCCKDERDCHPESFCHTAHCNTQTHLCEQIKDPDCTLCSNVDDCPAPSVCQNVQCTTSGTCSTSAISNCEPCTPETVETDCLSAGRCQRASCSEEGKCVYEHIEACCTQSTRTTDCAYLNPNACETLVCNRESGETEGVCGKKDKTLAAGQTCEPCTVTDGVIEGCHPNACQTATCSSGKCSYRNISNCTVCTEESAAEDCHPNACQKALCPEGKCEYAAADDLNGAACTPCSESDVSACNAAPDACHTPICVSGRCDYQNNETCEPCQQTTDCNDACYQALNLTASCTSGKCVYNATAPLAQVNVCCSDHVACAEGLHCVTAQEGDTSGTCAFNDVDIDYCALILAETTPQILAGGQVDVSVALTSAEALSKDALVVEFGFGTATVSGDPAFTNWIEATEQTTDLPTIAGVTNPRVFNAKLDATNTDVGTYEFAARISTDGGESFNVYCDSIFAAAPESGEENGVYHATDAGHFEVVACFETEDCATQACKDFTCNSAHECVATAKDNCCVQATECPTPVEMNCQASSPAPTCEMPAEGTEGSCKYTPIEDCCLTAEDCGEPNTCFSFACDLANTGDAYRTCIPVRNEACCTPELDCNPKDLKNAYCLYDAFTAPNGSCHFEEDPTACSTDNTAQCKARACETAPSCTIASGEKFGVCTYDQTNCCDVNPALCEATPEQKAQCIALSCNAESGLCEETSVDFACCDPSKGVSDCPPGKAFDRVSCVPEEDGYGHCHYEDLHNDIREACNPNPDGYSYNVFHSAYCVDAGGTIDCYNQGSDACDGGICDASDVTGCKRELCKLDWAAGEAQDGDEIGKLPPFEELCHKPVDACKLDAAQAVTFMQGAGHLDENGDFVPYQIPVSLSINESKVDASENLSRRITLRLGTQAANASGISSDKLTINPVEGADDEYRVTAWFPSNDFEAGEHAFYANLSVDALSGDPSFTACSVAGVHCVAGGPCVTDVSEGEVAINVLEQKLTSNSSDDYIKLYAPSSSNIYVYKDDPSNHRFEAQFFVDGLTNLTEGVDFLETADNSDASPLKIYVALEGDGYAPAHKVYATPDVTFSDPNNDKYFVDINFAELAARHDDKYPQSFRWCIAFDNEEGPVCLDPIDIHFSESVSPCASKDCGPVPSGTCENDKHISSTVQCVIDLNGEAACLTETTSEACPSGEICNFAGTDCIPDPCATAPSGCDVDNPIGCEDGKVKIATAVLGENDQCACGYELMECGKDANGNQKTCPANQNHCVDPCEAAGLNCKAGTKDGCNQDASGFLTQTGRCVVKEGQPACETEAGIDCATGAFCDGEGAAADCVDPCESKNCETGIESCDLNGNRVETLGTASLDPESGECVCDTKINKEATTAKICVENENHDPVIKNCSEICGNDAFCSDEGDIAEPAGTCSMVEGEILCDSQVKTSCNKTTEFCGESDEGLGCIEQDCSDVEAKETVVCGENPAALYLQKTAYSYNPATRQCDKPVPENDLRLHELCDDNKICIDGACVETHEQPATEDCIEETCSDDTHASIRRIGEWDRVKGECVYDNATEIVTACNEATFCDGNSLITKTATCDEDTGRCAAAQVTDCGGLTEYACEEETKAVTITYTCAQPDAFSEKAYCKPSKAFEDCSVQDYTSCHATNPDKLYFNLNKCSMSDGKAICKYSTDDMQCSSLDKTTCNEDNQVVELKHSCVSDANNKNAECKPVVTPVDDCSDDTTYACGDDGDTLTTTTFSCVANAAQKTAECVANPTKVKCSDSNTGSCVTHTMFQNFTYICRKASEPDKHDACDFMLSEDSCSNLNTAVCDDNDSLTTTTFSCEVNADGKFAGCKPTTSSENCSAQNTGYCEDNTLHITINVCDDSVTNHATCKSQGDEHVDCTHVLPGSYPYLASDEETGYQCHQEGDHASCIPPSSTTEESNP